MALKNLKEDLRKKADPKKAKFLPQFFRAFPGGYGEGDKFLGVKVPESRAIAKKYQDLSLKNINALLSSVIHEERLVALFILVLKMTKGSTKERQEIFSLYLKNLHQVNNWDLVDSSADKIIGFYLMDKEKDLLYRLSKSKNIWERRVSIISTFYFIRNNQFEHTIKISKILLHDKEDLIHKAVGWMLREIGKRDLKVLESFLREYCQKIPRTMLRYAIEKLPEKKRKAYLLI